MTSTSPFSNAEEASATAVLSEYERVAMAAAAAELEELPQRPPPSLAETSRLHGERPSAGQVSVMMSQTALKQVEAHSRSNIEMELGGALLGHVYRDGDQTYVEILAALPAVSLDHGPVHFTFTADAWSQLHHDRESHYPELNMVGWFHTHPDLGVFFSADDIVVHSVAFTLPWHVGLVVDPVRAEGCFFGWINGESGRDIVPLAGFYEQLDEQADSVVNWQWTPRANWTPPGNILKQAHQAGKVLLAETEWPALPPISPWWGLFLGGLSLLISLILLIDRFLMP